MMTSSAMALPQVQLIERALPAVRHEHGSNTGAWERAGKTAEGSAQRETSGSERVKVPLLQAQASLHAVRCSRPTPLGRGRGAAATSFVFGARQLVISAYQPLRH
ncbi:MAG: hypothetical protein WCH98_01255 [Verrucomicrobiota bacterium]